MTRTPAALPATARTLLLPLLAVAAAAALLAGASAAQAASNSGQSGCLVGYNYADPSNDYLFASSDGLASDCAWVRADIRNPGNMANPGTFESLCHGTQISVADGSYYAATSTYLDFSAWSTPCSNHLGAPEPYQRHVMGALYFIY